MELKVWGGAGEYGRSCYYVRFGQTRILLDCGVNKGGQEHYPLLEAEEVRRLDAVLLSHSHEDHSAAVPLLYRMGFTGEVYATSPTCRQFGRYVQAWRSTSARMGRPAPYGDEDVQAVRFRVLETPPADGAGGSMPLPGELRLQWGRSGHLLGAVWFYVTDGRQGLFYSGDYSPESALLADDPPAPDGPVDLALIDAAYGTDTDSQERCVERLFESVAAVADRGGKLLLPLPAYGRSQELLCLLADRFPGVPLAVEPDIWEPLQDYRAFPALLRPEARATLRRVEAAGGVLAAGGGDGIGGGGGRSNIGGIGGGADITVVADDEQREAVLQRPGPLLILSPDGMLQSERAARYLERLQGGAANAVLLTGHAAAGSPGRLLLQGRLPGVRAEAGYCRYKVHQGLTEVRLMLDRLQPQAAVLCHAAAGRTDELAALLRAEGRSGIVEAVRPGLRLSAGPA